MTENDHGVRRDLFGLLTAQKAIEILQAGNRRFVTGETITPEDAAARGILSMVGQRPFACILGCSDSRVPPERIFDVGIGQLFVIRGAGNTADDTAIGSIEYAAAHLRVPLVIVMGHCGCGMISSALSGGAASPYLNAIIARIQPVIDKVRRENPNCEQAPLCEDGNILNSISKLGESSILNGLCSSGELKIIGAKYELSTGVVNFWI